MVHPHRFLSLGLVTLLAAACPGSGEDVNNPPGGPICQDGVNCCDKGELVCTGDPDSTSTCRCFKAWDCETAVDPEKCWQNKADVPDGKGSWTCQAQGSVEKCVRPGSDVPDGKNGWVCTKTQTGVECTRPTNTPDGSSKWTCSYNGEFKSCQKTGGPNPGPETSPPVPDGGTPPTPDQFVPPTGDIGLPKGWNCTTNALGEIVCKKPDGGMPGGGGSFKCYWKNNVITCEGSSPTPPGGAGWQCVQNELVGGWRCTKPIGPDDIPDGTGGWNCYSGTPFNGAVCVKVPPKQPGKECLPGTKMWCDGIGYCGWGQVDCGPDGKWKTKLDTQTGKMILDCWELVDGRRPNTSCACHFFFWNKDCCETPDCIVPLGTNGQLCPVSPGGYCDYCNPNKTECTGVGAQCVVTTNNETYCGQDCTGGKPCPPQSSCNKIVINSVTVWQCMPNDLSCYY